MSAANTDSPAPSDRPKLDVASVLAGKHLVVIGGTGFLGKVWLSMLLDRYPDIGRLYLVVRAKPGLDAETRFWSETVESPAFDPIRRKWGEDGQAPGSAFKAFIRDKIRPIDGDVKRPNLGFNEAELAEMNGRVAALVNVAGVVDFNPPLDDALDVNAFGVQNLIGLSKLLGNIPVFHTSTCFVVGARDGVTPERNPLEFPFPRADELDTSHWNADREIAECIDLVEQAKRRVEDAPRQSHLLDEAKQRLRDRHEPTRGRALAAELEQVKDRYVREQLITAGKERAQFWGWPNIYTYTKSIGEQVLMRAPVPAVLVRPSIVEAALQYPVRGWCEGISTSTPIAYLAYKGQQNIPVEDKCHYDAIPVDMCAGAMIAILAELLTGDQQRVYQICSSDVNPLHTKRAAELIGLGKRRHFKNSGKGNPLLNQLQAHFEPAVVGLSAFQNRSAPAVHKAVSTLNRWLKHTENTAFAGHTRELRKSLRKAERTTGNIDKVFKEFIPFIARNDMRFSAAHTRALMDRLAPEDQARLPWKPQEIDWREFWMDVQLPGMEKWSFPLLEDRLKHKPKAVRRHDNLATMLDDLAEAYGHSVALQRLEGEELTRLTYLELQAAVQQVAAELKAAGVTEGTRVILAGQNHPEWVICYFAITYLAAVAIPLDREVDAEAMGHICAASGASMAIFDASCMVQAERLHPESKPAKMWLRETLVATARAQAEGRDLPKAAAEIPSDALASILYTSGTTGQPKGVMLSHENFTALVASLSPLFPLDQGDHVLSVLPLHHTFEFTCGMLLPLSRGARVVYLDEVNGERLAKGLKVGRITAMVGVPALWELLERRIFNEVSERGVVVEQVFRSLLDFNRKLGRGTGVDLGRILFAPVHAQLGGRLRTLISGAAALPPDVYRNFQGLGLQLAEGYGLTEAAPVLTVARASRRSAGRHVGKPIPDVEVRIDNPDADGVGEVLARGPNIMQGYVDDPDSSQASLKDGWLHTGDLGHLDKRGRLRLSGRSKEVIVPVGGENVFPDDVEQRLGLPKHIDELVVVGISDGRTGELVACLARVADSAYPAPETALDDDDELERRPENRKAAHAKAMEQLRAKVDGLPRGSRPSVLCLVDEKLPRTGTRKFKRSEARKIIEARRARDREALEAQSAQASQDPSARNERAEQAARGREILYRNLARIGRISRDRIRPGQELVSDLGFDSLMVNELSDVLLSEFPELDAQHLANCRSVEELEAACLGQTTAPQNTGRWAPEAEENNEIELPTLVREPMRALLGAAQHQSYAYLMRTQVIGAANIPHNRQTIVVANHSSHLDVGVIKHALGDYGKNLVSLGAKDYFFSNRWKRAYFGQLTNVAPIDRHGGMRKSLQEVGDYIDNGRIVLIFPEGTRSPDGRMREFLPGVGQMVLRHRIDILPIHVSGTHAAFPKGSSIPRLRSRLTVRIGAPLRYQDLMARHQNPRRAESARAIAREAQKAVEALRHGSVHLLEDLPALPSPDDVSETHARVEPKEPSNATLASPTPTESAPEIQANATAAEQMFPVRGEESNLASDASDEPSAGPGSHVYGPASPLKSVFQDLERRFRPGSCERTISFYFSLGRDPIDKWTLMLGPESYEFRNGRPEGDKADCVLKTSDEIFTRIVREGYTPGFREFITGRVKSNDIALLRVFQKAFEL